MRSLRVIAVIAVGVLVASGCGALHSAVRYSAAPGTVREPFWCAPTDGDALSANDCAAVSAQLDVALVAAHANLHASDAIAHGATGSAYETGVGAAFRFSGPTSTFDVQHPDKLLYDGTGPGAQVAGIEWNVAATSAPAGFTGGNDVWDDIGGGVWRLRVWMERPFQNEPNVFADTHPCLAAGGPVYDVHAACYTSTHPNPLEILVSNDDGYNAPGIDAAVQGLLGLPNVHVTVSAPLTNKSGTGGSTTPDPLTVDHLATLSGYPATAVHGFPADSVRYALQTMHVSPDLLVSGINNGQNLGPFVSLSGTVGAARVGGRDDIPSVALSQGLGSPADYPRGVTAMLSWVNDFLLGRVGPPKFESVVNVNIPTCTAGAIRGTLELPAATSTANVLSPSDCTSTATGFADDTSAFIAGYITVTNIGT